jgi:hypothetical protein
MMAVLLLSVLQLHSHDLSRNAKVLAFCTSPLLSVAIMENLLAESANGVLTLASLMLYDSQLVTRGTRLRTAAHGRPITTTQYQLGGYDAVTLCTTTGTLQLPAKVRPTQALVQVLPGSLLHGCHPFVTHMITKTSGRVFRTLLHKLGKIKAAWRDLPIYRRIHWQCTIKPLC